MKKKKKSDQLHTIQQKTKEKNSKQTFFQREGEGTFFGAEKSKPFFEPAPVQAKGDPEFVQQGQESQAEKAAFIKGVSHVQGKGIQCKCTNCSTQMKSEGTEQEKEDQEQEEALVSPQEEMEEEVVAQEEEQQTVEEDLVQKKEEETAETDLVQRKEEETTETVQPKAEEQESEIQMKADPHAVAAPIQQKVGGGEQVVQRSLWGKIKKGVKKIGSGIKKGVKKIGGGIKKGVKKIGGGLKKAGKWLGKAGKKAGKFLGKGAKLLGSKLKGIFQRSLRFITKLPSRLKNVVMTLWKGVKSLKPWSLKWWKSLGKKTTWRSFGFWLFELVLNTADLVGITDIYETLKDIVKFNTRPLNGHELSMAKGIFGNSINYGLVRLDLWALLGPGISGREYVSMHTINGWGGSITDDTFIHEMTHVWQYEKGGASYMSSALHAQAAKGSAAYSYGGVAGLEKNKNKGLSAYNPEAQAKIIQDYFRLKNGMGVGGGADRLKHIPLYEIYAKEVRK